MVIIFVVFFKIVVDCDFELGFCFWNQGVGVDFNWIMKNGKINSGNIGLLVDYILKNSFGYYIYIEVLGKFFNIIVRLISFLVYVRIVGVCLKFWYNMYGAYVNNFNFYYQSVFFVNNKYLFWNKYGN